MQHDSFRIVNPAGDYEKKRLKQNSNSICIGTETLDILCKTTNHLEMDENCCKRRG